MYIGLSRSIDRANRADQRRMHNQRRRARVNQAGAAKEFQYTTKGKFTEADAEESTALPASGSSGEMGFSSGPLNTVDLVRHSIFIDENDYEDEEEHARVAQQTKSQAFEAIM